MVSGLLAIVAAVPVWRGTEGPEGRPRALALGAAALVVVLAAVSLVISMSYESESAQSGDVLVTASNSLFEPEELGAGAGEVAVHADNEDQFRHTFTIDELEVNVELPAGKAGRATFDAEPGEYVFYCSVPGHEAMKGTLVVE